MTRWLGCESDLEAGQSDVRRDDVIWPLLRLGSSPLFLKKYGGA